MKTIQHFLLQCFLLLTLPVAAQHLDIRPSVVDCGKAAYQIPVTATFELQNSGSCRLVIDEVKPGCGCTAVSLPVRALEPGASIQLKVTYDARQLGHFEKTAAIFYHADQTGVSSLSPLYVTMKGVVLAEVKDYSGLYPVKLGELLADCDVLEFDDVNQGDRPQQVINIFNDSEHLMQPNVQHLPSYLTAETIPNEMLPGKGGKVVLTLHTDKLHDFGLTQTTIHLASQLGEKVRPDTEIPVSVVLLPNMKSFEGQNYQYAPRLELSDSVVRLGMINGKLKKKTAVILKNSGRLPLVISSLQMFTAGLRLTLHRQTLQPGEQTKLRIVADLDRLKKVRTKPRVLMITNDPDHAKVVLPIHLK